MNKVLSNIRRMSSGGGSSFKKVDHLVCDMDGLLLDTEVLYTLATQNVLDLLGVNKVYTWDVKVQLMGLQREDVSKRIVQIYDLPITWEEYADMIQEQIEDLMTNCKLCPGDLLKSYNKPYPWEVRMKVLGTTERKTCEIAVKEMQLPCTVDEFHKQFVNSCLQNLSNVHLLKGAERLIRHMNKHSIPICLATSSSTESVDVKTTYHKELFTLFHHKVMGSSDPEVKEGKPAPDIFLIAASRFPGKPKPENCLVFEDAPNGVKAAVAAGMQVVMVPDSHVTEEQKEGATIVLKSLMDFKPEAFGLPPFDD